MPPAKDYTGKKFNDLTAVEATDKRHRGRVVWLLKCVCGNTLLSEMSHVTSGRKKRCDRCRSKANSERLTKHGNTIGKQRSPEYNIWIAMKARCFNSKHRSYHNYGGRGITVCDRWLGGDGFKNFLADLGARPKHGTYLLDRENNNGNYEPSNCRWVTSKRSANNKRGVVTVTWNGVTKTLSEWADETGVVLATLWGRWSTGRRGDELFAKGRLKKRCRGTQVNYRGETHSLVQWSIVTEIPYTTLCRRYKQGLQDDELFWKGSLKTRKKVIQSGSGNEGDCENQSTEDPKVGRYDP